MNVVQSSGSKDGELNKTCDVSKGITRATECTSHSVRAIAVDNRLYGNLKRYSSTCKLTQECGTYIDARSKDKNAEEDKSVIDNGLE